MRIAAPPRQTPASIEIARDVVFQDGSDALLDVVQARVADHRLCVRGACPALDEPSGVYWRRKLDSPPAIFPNQVHGRPEVVPRAGAPPLQLEFGGTVRRGQAAPLLVEEQAARQAALEQVQVEVSRIASGGIDSIRASYSCRLAGPAGRLLGGTRRNLRFHDLRLKKERSAFEVVYAGCRARGTVLESRLAAYYPRDNARFLCHRMMDLLTVRCSQLAFPELVPYQENEGSEHVGLGHKELKNPKLLLSQYRAVQRELCDALLALLRSSVPASRGPARCMTWRCAAPTPSELRKDSFRRVSSSCRSLGIDSIWIAKPGSID